MLNISEGLKSAFIHNPGKNHLWVGIGNHYTSEIEYVVSENEIITESLEIDQNCNKGDIYPPYGGVASKIELDIVHPEDDLFQKVISVSIYNEYEPSTKIPLIQAHIYECDLKHNSRVRHIVGYDATYLTYQVDLTYWYHSIRDQFPMTVRDFRLKMFNEMLGYGSTQAQYNLNIDSMVIGYVWEGRVGIKAQDVLESMARLSGTMFQFNESGAPTWVDLSTTPATQSVPFQKDVDWEEYTIGPIELIRYVDVLEDNVTVVTTCGDESTTKNILDIKDDFLAHKISSSDLYPYLSQAFRKLQNITYRVFEGIGPGMPWVKCGDKVTYNVIDWVHSVTEPVYTTQTFLILHRNLTGLANLTDTFSAEDESDHDDSRAASTMLVTGGTFRGRALDVVADVGTITSIHEG